MCTAPDRAQGHLDIKDCVFRGSQRGHISLNEKACAFRRVVDWGEQLSIDWGGYSGDQVIGLAAITASRTYDELQLLDSGESTQRDFW